MNRIVELCQRLGTAVLLVLGALPVAHAQGDGEPQILRTSPYAGASNVPRNTTISIFFDRPLHLIAGCPPPLVNFWAWDRQDQPLDAFDASLINSVLSRDGTRVTCVNQVLFPANARIDFQLAQCLADKDGRLLQPNASGGYVVFFTSSNTPAPPPPLILSNVTGSGEDGISFQFATQRGTEYEVQQSLDLRNEGGWIPVLSTNAASSSIQFRVPGPLSGPATFYRVVRY